jgi:Uma2 family endonuclease
MTPSTESGREASAGQVALPRDHEAGSRCSQRLHLHVGLNGITLDPWEFDEATAEPGYRYELIHGVLIVNPAPLEEERDPNDELSHLLRLYQRTHPEGKSLDVTLPEHDVIVGVNRRRVDRAIWCGLGRLPHRGEVPSICVEFVSAGRHNQTRDYLEKRNEYKLAGVQEYWVIDRFERRMLAIRFSRDGDQEIVVAAGEHYETPRLPGFVLPLGDLLAIADRWQRS